MYIFYTQQALIISRVILHMKNSKLFYCMLSLCRPQRDPFYDTESEQRDMKVEEDAKKAKQRQIYVKRVIVHPSFHNISFAETVKLMQTMKQGEAIVRPSSKGADHLTVTWKVTDEILQHIDVREEGKENAFSLGQSLWIGNEEFEDLDEIIARHVNPMAAYVSELLDFKYYKLTVEGIKDRAEEILKEQKKENPNGIPYIVSAAKVTRDDFLAYQVFKSIRNCNFSDT